MLVYLRANASLRQADKKLILKKDEYQIQHPSSESWSSRYIYKPNSPQLKVISGPRDGGFNRKSLLISE